MAFSHQLRTAPDEFFRQQRGRIFYFSENHLNKPQRLLINRGLCKETSTSQVLKGFNGPRAAVARAANDGFAKISRYPLLSS
jgi:hypothetical protein